MSSLLRSRFRIGVNYWSARTAMDWWRSFDLTEVATDFERIAATGFDCVRIFLTWEDFQPTSGRLDTAAVGCLVSAMDAASVAGLVVMPTLFTGHMSGVNWIPAWALGGDSGDQRFRVICGGRAMDAKLANWFSDPSIALAQATLAGELAGALAGHGALWAWDLGNENSNCVLPPNKALARAWLLRMTEVIRHADASALVTLGLHMEDLEQDRILGPREAAEVCDFIQMHGYPGYAAWARGPTDEQLLPFLARLTRCLAGGAEVLFAEFGVPTTTARVGGGQCDPTTFRPVLSAQEKRVVATSDPGLDAEHRGVLASCGPTLVGEDAAAAYIERALGALLDCGTLGAMLWCYCDYVPAIWGRPPLDLATHERSFGLWRGDGSAKSAVAVIKAFAKRRPRQSANPVVADSTWLDVGAEEFYRDPGPQIRRLYRRYCAAVDPGSPPPPLSGSG